MHTKEDIQPLIIGAIVVGREVGIKGRMRSVFLHQGTTINWGFGGMNIRKSRIPFVQLY